MKRLLSVINAPLSWYRHRCQCVIPNVTARRMFHAGHGALHLLYFGAVALEGHGIYAMAGGSLLITGVVGVFLRDNDHE